jgi:hypothetical protein
LNGRSSSRRLIELRPIIHHENLLAAYDQLEHEAGQAPGLDGVHFSDLGRRERADILCAVARAPGNGTYHPGAARHCDSLLDDFQG